VGDRVLNDEGLDPVRMREHHAKAHGAAIVLHVKRVAREPERFGEINHDLGAAIERVGEFFRVRPIAVPEPRIIRRDEVIAVGKQGEQGLEHPRRRGKAVQQEQGGRVFRAGLSVKDGEPIDLGRTIKSRMFLSLVLSSAWASDGRTPVFPELTSAKLLCEIMLKQ
jgi:hypothetical protein